MKEKPAVGLRPHRDRRHPGGAVLCQGAGPEDHRRRQPAAKLDCARSGSRVADVGRAPDWGRTPLRNQLPGVERVRSRKSEDCDPLYDSQRDYITQLDRYKRHQGKRTTGTTVESVCVICGNKLSESAATPRLAARSAERKGAALHRLGKRPEQHAPPDEPGCPDD